MIELNDEQEVRAVKLHSTGLVLDSLVGDYAIYDDKYFDRMQAGGVDVAWVTVGGDSLTQTVKSVAQVSAAIRRRSDKMVHVTTVAEIHQAKHDGKVAVLFGTQNGACLEGDISLLEFYYTLGYRVMGLTYSGANFLGCGCADLTRDTQGLSFDGIDALKEMNRLGILVDMSHSGDATTWDALRLSKKPVVFTHCNARALSNTARNKPDDQIKAMAATGGVMGVTPLPRMVNNDLHQATLDGLLDHIDYIANLVGIDHVGIGTDFTDTTEFYSEPVKLLWTIWRERRPEMLGTWQQYFTVPYPKDIHNMSKHTNLTRGLVARGYSDEKILKILGGNWLRVFEAATAS